MLTLPIKEKWFNLILTGEKKEEYRDITPYYTARFKSLWEDPEVADTEPRQILFRNGYSGASPSFIATCTLTRRTGHVKWGAKPKQNYYVLNIIDVKPA